MSKSTLSSRSRVSAIAVIPRATPGRGRRPAAPARAHLHAHLDPKGLADGGGEVRLEADDGAPVLRERVGRGVGRVGAEGAHAAGAHVLGSRSRRASSCARRCAAGAAPTPEDAVPQPAMAEPVVDRLDLVAVDEHHRGAGGGALARAELLRDGVQERPGRAARSARRAAPGARGAGPAGAGCARSPRRRRGRTGKGPSARRTAAASCAPTAPRSAGRARRRAGRAPARRGPAGGAHHDRLQRPDHLALAVERIADRAAEDRPPRAASWKARLEERTPSTTVPSSLSRTRRRSCAAAAAPTEPENTDSSVAAPDCWRTGRVSPSAVSTRSGLDQHPAQRHQRHEAAEGTGEEHPHPGCPRLSRSLPS